MDQGIVLLEQRVADDDGEFRAVLFCDIAGGGGELFGSHVVGRRVDEVAAEKDAGGDARDFLAVDARRQDKLRGAGLALLVARELIGAENPGQRAALAAEILRHIGEAIGAGGKLFGKYRERELVAALAQTQNRGCDAARGIREQLQFAFARRETGAFQEGGVAFGQARQEALQPVLGHGVQGRGVARGLDEARMHRTVPSGRSMDRTARSGTQCAGGGAGLRAAALPARCRSADSVRPERRPTWPRVTR